MTWTAFAILAMFILHLSISRTSNSINTTNCNTNSITNSIGTANCNSNSTFNSNPNSNSNFNSETNSLL